jgi:hypothetical protein
VFVVAAEVEYLVLRVVVEAMTGFRVLLQIPVRQADLQAGSDFWSTMVLETADIASHGFFPDSHDQSHTLVHN